MTATMLRDPERRTGRFRSWGGWLAFLLLAGQIIFCHGCHGDEDNELCVRPHTRSFRGDPQGSASPALPRGSRLNE